MKGGLLAFAVLLSGCNMMPAMPARSVHDFCAIAHPITFEPGEPAKLSDATASQIVSHNRTYKKICKP